MEFSFTVYNSYDINKRIFSDLEIIKKLIITAIPDTSLLVLVGGFGRGEGSVLLEDGIPKPLNDYDVVLILRKTVNISKLKKLSREIADEVGIRLIDLIPIKRSKLSRLPITMFNYDMKYGGYIFYGKEDVLNEIPNYDSSKMPLVEGKILLFNRMICLLESYSEKFKIKEPDNKEEFFLVNQAGKAILACCDSLLLSKGLYHHSYAERCKCFAKAFKENEKLVQLVCRATDFKLRPTKEIDFNTVDYWFEAREEFLLTLKTFLELFYKTLFTTWEDFCLFYYRNQRSSLGGWIRRLTRLGGMDYRTQVELAELLLLSANNRTSQIKRYVEEARSRIERVSNEKYPKNVTWEFLRRECVKLWFNYLH